MTELVVLGCVAAIVGRRRVGVVALRRVDAREHHPARRAGPPDRGGASPSRAFVLGATAAGAALGAVIGAARVAARRWQRTARLAALAVAALAAIALDARRLRVPGPNRQVNERWLDEYRGWVYGLGFGAQLGLGITTRSSRAPPRTWPCSPRFLSGEPRPGR